MFKSENTSISPPKNNRFKPKQAPSPNFNAQKLSTINLLPQNGHQNGDHGKKN